MIINDLRVSLLSTFYFLLLMGITDKVKSLISEGRTQDAIDQLQRFLAGKDADLMNQTILLESQFKEMTQKKILGDGDAEIEINRINYTLLSLCDDAKKRYVVAVPDDDDDFEEKNETKASFAVNPLLVFVIILVLGIGVVLILVFGSDSLK